MQNLQVYRNCSKWPDIAPLTICLSADLVSIHFCVEILTAAIEVTKRYNNLSANYDNLCILKCFCLGTNDGEDLPSELLSAIYDRVEKVRNI